MTRRIRVYEQTDGNDVVVVRHHHRVVPVVPVVHQPIYAPRARIAPIPDSAADASLNTIHRSVWHQQPDEIIPDSNEEKNAYVRHELQDWL